MSLEDVIAGALSDAREEGAIEESAGEDAPVVAVEGEGSGDDPVVIVPGAEGDDDDEGDGEAEKEPVVDVKTKDSPTTVKKEEKPKEEVKDETLDKELGDPKDKHGRENRIPYSAVKRITQNAETRGTTRAITTVAKALGVEAATLTPETLETSIGAVVRERNEYKNYADGFIALEPVMKDDPDTFMTWLAKANPGYQKYVDAVAGKTTAPAALPDAANDPEPQPDVEVTLADGRKGMSFSLESSKKHTEWLERKFERKYNAALDARFKPLDDARTKAEKASESHAAFARSLSATIAEAREDWAGFKDHEKEIETEIKTMDPKIPFARALRRAYDKVVVGKLRTDKATTRAEVLKELEKAPNGTSEATTPRKKEKTVARDAEGNEITGTLGVIARAVAEAKANGSINSAR